MELTQLFSEGTWIVHTNYGVGKVVRLEKKHMDGNANLYYRVEGDNSTFWIPVDHSNSTRFRSIATKEKMQSAIQALGDPPHKLESNHIQRKIQIKEIISTGAIIPYACLVRDMSRFASEKNLSMPEQEMLDDLKGRLVAEWSLVMDIEPQAVRTKLDKLLKKYSN